MLSSDPIVHFRWELEDTTDIEIGMPYVLSSYTILDYMDLLVLPFACEMTNSVVG
jgi:hypothetical protein